MTLLEAVVALMILGMSVTGLLEGLQAAARAERDAAAWSRAVAIAESAVATAGSASSSEESLPPGFTRAVDIRPWRGSVSRVVVTVTTPHGAHFVLHRLVRESRRSDP